MSQDDMLKVAQTCVEIAKKKGAQDASARTYRVRDVTVTWRDGKLEKIQEASPALCAILEKTIKTGTYCEYRPELLGRN